MGTVSFLLSVCMENGSLGETRAFLAFETDKVRGKGLLRLQQQDGKFDKAYTFFTV